MMFRQRLLLAALAITLPVTSQQDPDANTSEHPIRIMLRARNGGADRLNPLRYIGGFETKTLLFETLVRRGDDGRIAPGLASSWTISEDKRAVQFELRQGARFHDGTLVTAEAVRDHFRRWVGHEEHDWLAVNQRITEVTSDGPRRFTVHLDRPYALLGDLCAINPCAIVGPTARDWEGEFTRPMGTGTFRFVGASDNGARWHLAATHPGGPALDVKFAPRGRDTAPIDALLHDEIDAFVGGWDEDLPAQQLNALSQDERFVVQTCAGSAVAYLSFRLDAGPTADITVRRRIAAAIKRTDLIAEVEGGRATPCTSWAAPSVAFWPRGKGGSSDVAPHTTGDRIKLRITAGRAEARSGRIAAAVARQLQHAGFEVERLSAATPTDADTDTSGLAAVGTVQAIDEQSGEARKRRGRAIRAQMELADVRVQMTHGIPYDPQRSLAARFGPKASDHPDAPQPPTGVPARLVQLVGLTMAEPDEMTCLPIYAEIQAILDQEALIVPLYSPHRIALHKRAVAGIKLSNDMYRVDLSNLHWQQQ